MTAIETQARAIFLAALDRAPGQWPELLAERCGNDADLRARVEQLLHAHQAIGSIPGSAAEPATAAEVAGTVLAGRYRLVEPVGEGGMGTVWMAEQTDPVKRQVAVKLIKPGMDSKVVLARFEAERQALALMDHPNIAKVHDAGATPDGRPFFVMELVKGVPITKYCDDHHRTPRERLELFVPVCQALQHAHQKGVIHRDVKPSNVLVASYDGRPVPKVIDFGVAKAAGQPLTEQTLHTGFGVMVGTVEYMSPEQASFDQLDVDTRSDIYSLGVLLYELLAGSPPFTQKELEKAGVLEMLRVIREQEPSKPSTKLSTAEGLPSLAANRGTEPARLTKLVRGELDWIVMKALEKDRSRRYETANGLATDVQRYLADEPVVAGPPSAWYRFGKFARRNRGPVLAAALVALALIGGIVGTTWGLVRARAAQAEAETKEREADAERTAAVAAAAAERAAKEAATNSEAETRAVLDFVQNRVFAAARPKDEEGGLGHDVPLRTALKAALAFVETSFGDRPLIEARLRLALGVSFWYLGDIPTAADQYERARTLYTRHRGPADQDTIRATHNLAMTHSARGRHDVARELFEGALVDLKAVLGPDHHRTLLTMNGLADVYYALKRHEDALKFNEDTLARMKATLGPDHPDTLMSANNLANSYAASNRLADALKLHEETLPRMRAVRGPDHTDTLSSMTSLANTYGALERDEEALELREQVVRLREAKLSRDHPETLKAMNNLAHNYAALGRHADALKLRRETLDRRTAVLGPDDRYTLQSMHSVASSLVKLDRGAEAVPLIDECVRRARGNKAVDPRVIPWALELRLEHFAKVKDAAGCRATAEMWEGLSRADPASLYDAGRMRAVTATVVPGDPKTPPADAARLAGEEADAAMAWLTKAVAAGFKDVDRLRTNKDLDLLRRREDFQKLVAELEGKRKG